MGNLQLPFSHFQIGWVVLFPARNVLISVLFWKERKKLGVAGPESWAHSCSKGDLGFEIPSNVHRSENSCLSRGVTTWLPHMYPGRSARQAQDCHHEPGQGELGRGVGRVGTPKGLGLGWLGESTLLG